MKKSTTLLLYCLIGMYFGLILPNLTLAQTDLQLRVTSAESGPDGTAWDGARIFALPLETSLTSPPDLAVCVHTDAGETACDPNDVLAEESPCPDRKSCILSVRLQKPFSYFVVSVFDIDPFGKNFVRSMRGPLRDSLRLLEQEFDMNIQTDEIDNSIELANARRWQWMESFGFTKDLEANPFTVGDEETHRMARTFAAAIAPVQVFDHFETGRISGPFDVKSVWDCLYPAPACFFEYLEVTINSKVLSDELDN